MNLYFWSSCFLLLLHSSCGASTRNERQLYNSYQQQNQYPQQQQQLQQQLQQQQLQQQQQPYYFNRGNTKFQVPTYLTQESYARPIYESDRRGGADGSYSYEYQTDNAINVKQESTGYGRDKIVRGHYSHVGPDGVTYTVHYIADKFGYRAYGAHLPTQPDSLFDQTKFPVQPIQQQLQQQYPVNRPITQNQVFVTPRPPQQSYYAPPQQQQQQHQQQQQNQVVYYSQPTQLSPQQVFVTQPTPPNYVEITPKPHYSISTASYGNNRVPTSTQLPLSAVAPYNFITTPQQPNRPQVLWTNDRNHYQHGFSTTTPSSIIVY